MIDSDPHPAFFRIAPPALIASGICLSVVSLLGICSDACSEAHTYRLYGLDFGWAGIVTFAALAALRFSRAIRFALPVFAVTLSSACGAEAWFLYIQKTVIGSWCPLCVSIAVVVFLLAGVTTAESLLDKGVSMRFTNVFKRLVVAVSGALFGFLIAFFGVAKPDAEAQTLAIWLGKPDSPAEVYVVTDWFCPGCRKAEPEIEAGVRSVLKQAKVVFVDYAIHPESLNFSPYNLSFQINEKEKYLQLRGALHGLALKTKTPSVEAVQAAVAPFGVRLRQMSMSDIMTGINLYTTMIRSVGATQTPTVVVRNAKTGKVVRKLEGGDKIKASDIRAAVQEVLR
jgi:thiol-disulfide isomerase/thioredoxin